MVEILINIKYDKTMKLNKEVICFTGKSLFTRSKMSQLARQAGARITSNITKETTLLVIGQRSGSKLERAMQMNIPIMADEEFLKQVMKSKSAP